MMSAGFDDIRGGNSSITIDGLEVSPNVSHVFDLFKQFRVLKSQRKHQWWFILALVPRNARAFRGIHIAKKKKR